MAEGNFLRALFSNDSTILPPEKGKEIEIRKRNLPAPIKSRGSKLQKLLTEKMNKVLEWRSPAGHLVPTLLQAAVENRQDPEHPH